MMLVVTMSAHSGWSNPQSTDTGDRPGAAALQGGTCLASEW